MSHQLLVVITMALTCLSTSLSAAPEIKVIDLRCEYLVNPLGIDVTQPRLSWKLQSDVRGQKQSQYQIIVASSLGKLNKGIGDLWDTGIVSSNQTTHIPYNGIPLKSSMQAFWKVSVWGKDRRESGWSNSAMWSMGLLQKSDWSAEWIGYDATPKEVAKMPVRNFKHKPKAKPKFKSYLPAQYLRKDFRLTQKVTRAALHVTAQGHVEMHVNGQRVGNEYFTPGWTDYRKRIYYRTYDVTDMLANGPNGSNAMGAILGDGWFRGNISILGQNQYGKKLRLLSQLHITYADGSSEVIASDRTWKASFGPIILSDMFEGETYDARKEISGWNKPNYNDKSWAAVNTGAEINPVIEAYPGVPVRPILELPTVKLTEPKPNTYVFDLGQNFSGWARLKVTGNAGDKINMQFAEMLNADGIVYQDNLRSARAADNYILKGGGLETYEPHFTFHGFRYVQVTGLTAKPNKDTITGIVIHSDAPMTSTFECSNPLLNQLHSNVVWGQRSNYLEVPTDCPQRDERLGWTGDTQVFIRSGCNHQNVSAFFTKWIIDLMDTQNKAGTFGQQAPVFHGHGSPAWADAGVICPWTIYQIYGDQRIIRENYAAMARFIDYCHSKKGLVGQVRGFGDWLAVGSKTPKELISAAYFGYSTSLMAKMAEGLGKNEDAAKYNKLFNEIRTNFQQKFVKPDGTIAGHSQTAYCLALYFNLLTEKQRTQASGHLVDRIKAKDYHLSVGFVGVSLLLPTLTEIGRSDLAYRLIQNKTYPSWGYSIEQGATTIWERWNSYTHKDGFGDVGMNSFNHYAYGACSEWMFRSMLGIDTDGPGFKKITMKPELGEGVTWAKGHYDSIQGRISSSWKREGKAFQWAITVPTNVSSTVFVPAADLAHVAIDGKPAKGAKGVEFLRMENNRAVILISSGSFLITSKIASQ
ncbi:MAG: glycoside hydrolase family 78 protein [Verrucomicrobiae bacterium]|nr:glycoside hydrolase family 78 protein [Verrucomicrobiae bacterium]